MEVAYKQYLIVGNVYNLSEQKCFNYGNNNLVHPIAIPCTAELTQILEMTLKEMYYSQDLLFNGKLQEYQAID